MQHQNTNVSLKRTHSQMTANTSSSKTVHRPAAAIAYPKINFKKAKSKVLEKCDLLKGNKADVFKNLKVCEESVQSTKASSSLDQSVP